LNSAKENFFSLEAGKRGGSPREGQCRRPGTRTKRGEDVVELKRKMACLPEMGKTILADAKAFDAGAPKPSTL